MSSATELFVMDEDELAGRLVESRRELLNLRFQLATGQLDNFSQIRRTRRDIARILTVLRTMEIASAEGVELEFRVPSPVGAARRPSPRRVEEIEPQTPDLEASMPSDAGQAPVVAKEASGEIEGETTAPRPRRARRTKEPEPIEELETSDHPAVAEYESPGAQGSSQTVQGETTAPRPRRTRRTKESEPIEELEASDETEDTGVPLEHIGGGDAAAPRRWRARRPRVADQDPTDEEDQ